MQKTWTWTTTGYSFVGKSLVEISQTCQHAGLAGVEAALEVFPSETDAQLESVAAGFAAAGLGFDSFHLPFAADDDICSFYETTRKKAVEKAQRSMERAAILGARVGIQHPTTNRFDAEAEGLDRYLKQLDKSLQVLLPAAEKLNFTLVLENMLPGDQGGRLCSRPEHFERIATEFGHSNLGFCLDTGHALVAGGGHEGALAFVEAMAPTWWPFTWRTMPEIGILISLPVMAGWTSDLLSAWRPERGTPSACALRLLPSPKARRTASTPGYRWWKTPKLWQIRRWLMRRRPKDLAR